MPKLRLKPLGDVVVIDRDQEPEPDGKIVVIDSRQEPPRTGTVLAIGPGKRNDKGKVVPINERLEVGQRIRFMSNADHNTVEVDGNEYLLLREDWITGIIDE